MKKIFTYLAVAALVAVACDDMYGPVETPVAPDKAGSVEIQIDTLGDDTLAFTISPVGDAAYYSYFVAAGPAQAVDSAAVYQCKLDGLIKGTFKAAEDSEAHLAVGELTPNTPYTIYAVAGSPMGIAGSVAVKEVVTTDGVTIKLVEFDDTVTDSTVVLTFSEMVFPGKGEITATYYASNLEFKEMGTVKAVADSVIYDGNTVTVQFAGLPHGAHWAVSYPEGTFTDSAQNKIAALASGYSAEAKKMAGVHSRKDTVAFALEAAFPEEQQMFNDLQTAIFSIGTAVDSTLAAIGDGAATVSYVTSGKITTFDMELDATYGFGESDGKSGVWMVCPQEAPSYGNTIVFSYEEDAFQDIWGNPTKAVDLVTLYAYDYVFADVLGTYNFVAVSGFDQKEILGSFVVEKSDKEENGNVMITSFTFSDKWDQEAPIYADFTPEAGTMEIYGFQWIASAEAATPDDPSDDYDRVFYTYEYEWLVLNMVEKGVLTDPNDMFGVLAVAGNSPLGWNALYADFYAEKVGATEPEPASVSSSDLYPASFELRSR